MLLVQMVGDGLLWVSEFLRLIIITEGCYRAGSAPGELQLFYAFLPTAFWDMYYCYHIIYRLSGELSG